MKKLITLLITLAMVFSLAVPAFAAEEAPVASAPVKLSAKEIKAITPKGVKAASYSYTKIKVTWNRIEGVDGYKVYRATSKTGKYTCIFTNKSEDKLQVINTGRTTGKTYYYKVRGYKKIGKTTYYTKYSTVASAAAKLSAPKISKVKCLTEPLIFNNYDYKVRVYWGKISGATGYQMYRKRTDKSDWKLFKSVSSKYTYATDKLLGKEIKPWGPNGPTDYDYSDLKYEWEYKVRAYRTVNGKKVYSSFSKADRWVPDWTIEEVKEELIAYVESLKWPVHEYANPDGSPNEDGEWLVPKKDGSTYSLKHEEGCSSWSPGWPMPINPYRSKAELMKDLKESARGDAGDWVAASPLHWANASISGAAGPNLEDEYWDGREYFSVDYETYLNGYKLWVRF